MNTDLMTQNLHAGLMLACLGMLVVMLFLTLMIGVMKINEFIIGKLNKIFPEEIKEEPKRNVNSKTDEEIAVAIAAAMNHHGLIKGGN